MVPANTSVSEGSTSGLVFFLQYINVLDGAVHYIAFYADYTALYSNFFSNHCWVLNLNQPRKTSLFHLIV